MTYQQCFDHLGNPIARRSRTPIGHRIVRTISVICIVILMALLYGAHP